MANKNIVTIQIQGDSRSIEKALDNTAKKLERTRKQAKTTQKDVKDLGGSFSQAANQVTIFNGQLDPISGRLSAIGTGISRFGVASVAASAGVAALTLGVYKTVDALETYEQRQNRFEALLQSTSYAARLTASDLEELAQTTARATLGDVAGTSEAINALLTFRSVQGQVFKETIKLAGDAKVAFGGNLVEGVVAFGKALNDPIANLGALSRKGIQFTDAQKEMIESFVESGDLVKAQELILKELGDQFGGLASKEAPELKSSLDSLSQSWDNMLEGFGRTEEIEGVRYVMARIAKGADITFQRIAEGHSKQAIEMKKIEELENNFNEALNKRVTIQNKLDELREKQSRSRDEKAYQNEIDRAIVLRNTYTSLYLEAEKAFQGFINKKKKEQADERDQIRLGIIGSLNKELSALEGQSKKIQKSLNKRSIALLSGFESERQKVARVFAEKTKDYEKDYGIQLKIVDNIEKKQIEILEKSGAKKSEINEFLAESDQRRLDLKQKYSEDMILAEQGRQAKLDKLDERDAARALAIENRQKRAAQAAGKDFKKDVDLDFKKQDTTATEGVEGFFGVNIDEVVEKQERMLEIYAQHLAAIDELDIEYEDKKARRDEVAREFAIKQQELEKQGREQAYGDMWSAIGTLGASGSKKLFALAKAANIVQAVMSTYTAAANAMAQVAYPYNFVAAATVAAAGFVQVRNIKNQKMPQFHDGIDYVPREGSYLLDKGERVLDSRLNADLKEDLKRRNSGSGGDGDVAISLMIPDTGNYNAMDQWYQDNSDAIVEHVKYAMNRP